MEISYTELAGPYEYTWDTCKPFNASPGMGMTSSEVVSPAFDITLNVEISGPGGICAEQFDVFVDVIEEQIVPIIQTIRLYVIVRLLLSLRQVDIHSIPGILVYQEMQIQLRSMLVVHTLEQ